MKFLLNVLTIKITATFGNIHVINEIRPLKGIINFKFHVVCYMYLNLSIILKCK